MLLPKDFNLISVSLLSFYWFFLAFPHLIWIDFISGFVHWRKYGVIWVHLHHEAVLWIRIVLMPIRIRIRFSILMPDSDPTSSRKMRKFFYFCSHQCQIALFYLSHQCHRKKYSLSLRLVKMDTDPDSVRQVLYAALDPDPVKWWQSDRIRIHNTAMKQLFKNTVA